MKSMRIDLTGERFGRLAVLSYAGNDCDGRALWTCLCDCGVTKIVSGKYMRSSRVRSCGCLHREMLSKASTTHGMTGTPTYTSWASMLTRCSNPNQIGFDHYGALGVNVCERWEKFENFFSDMGSRPEGMTLDRKNPFGNYDPNNCKWATAQEQSINRRGAMAIAILARLLESGVISQENITIAFNDGYKSWSPAEAFEGGYTRI